MRLDKKTLGVLGESLDRHNVPVEDRQLRFAIDGVDYYLDAKGCWRFTDDGHEVGWVKCTMPEVLAQIS